MSLDTQLRAQAKRQLAASTVKLAAGNPAISGVIVVVVLGVAVVVLVVAGALVSVMMAGGQNTTSNTTVGTANGVGLAAGAPVPAAYRPLILGATATRCTHVLTAPILAAQLRQESGWNPKAISPVGAQGLAQFMPATWAAHGVDGNGDGIVNVWDPRDAIPSAAGYDCALAAIVAKVPGDPASLMLAAYNAGPYAVLSYHGVPPYAETQNYVRIILTGAKQMGAALTSPALPAGGGGPLGSGIVTAAAKRLGVVYVYGGGGWPQGPSGIGRDGRGPGFDCSGLVQWAVGTATGGRTVLPRTAAEQVTQGTPIPADLAAMQPGDLIGFAATPGGYVDHIGIYVGGGQMINAPHTGSDVRYADLTHGYYTTVSWVVRRLG